MSSVDFDRVLRMVGDNGRYQTFMFIVLCIPATIPLAFMVFLNVFTTATPDHWCKASPKFDIYNITTVNLKYLTVPYSIRSDGNKVFSQCSMYDVESSVYRDLFEELVSRNDTIDSNDVLNVFNDSISEEIPLKNCTYGWQYDKRYYDNTLVTELNLVCGYNWFPQTTTAVFYTGSIFGNVFFGWVSDRWGRRVAILWLIFLEVLISIITCFSVDHKMYLVMRALGGLIFPALYHTPLILGIEMMGPKHRSLAGMLICMMFATSMSLLALLAFLLRDWFKLSIATSFPFILLFSYYWIIPESPRWLLSRGKINKAEKVLENIARFNGTVIPKNILHEVCENTSKSTPLISETKPSVTNMNGYIEKQTQITKETSLISSEENIDTKEIQEIKWNDNESDKILKKSNFSTQIVKEQPLNNSKNIPIEDVKKDNENLEKLHSTEIESMETDINDKVPKATLLDIFRYPNIKKKFLLFTFVWMANATVYNGLSYNATNLGVNDFLAFFIAAVIEIPSNLLAWYLMGIWGRRWVLCFSFTIGGLGCLCCMFVPEKYVWIIVILATIGKFGIAASFSVFYIFVSESFPTVIRSQVMGFASLIVSIGMLAFPYILQLAQFSRVLPMVILGLISLSAACASMFLPETLNEPMPQSLEDGENFGKGFKIFSMPKRQFKKFP